MKINKILLIFIALGVVFFVIHKKNDLFIKEKMNIILTYVGEYRFSNYEKGVIRFKNEEYFSAINYFKKEKNDPKSVYMIARSYKESLADVIDWETDGVVFSNMKKIEKNRLDEIDKMLYWYEKVYIDFPDSYLADDSLSMISAFYLRARELKKSTEYYLKILNEYPNTDLYNIKNYAEYSLCGYLRKEVNLGRGYISNCDELINTGDGLSFSEEEFVLIDSYIKATEDLYLAKELDIVHRYIKLFMEDYSSLVDIGSDYCSSEKNEKCELIRKNLKNNYHPYLDYKSILKSHDKGRDDITKFLIEIWLKENMNHPLEKNVYFIYSDLLYKANDFDDFIQISDKYFLLVEEGKESNDNYEMNIENNLVNYNDAYFKKTINIPYYDINSDDREKYLIIKNRISNYLIDSLTKVKPEKEAMSNTLQCIYIEGDIINNIHNFDLISLKENINHLMLVLRKTKSSIIYRSMSFKLYSSYSDLISVFSLLSKDNKELNELYYNSEYYKKILTVFFDKFKINDNDVNVVAKKAIKESLDYIDSSQSVVSIKDGNFEQILSFLKIVVEKKKNNYILNIKKEYLKEKNWRFKLIDRTRVDILSNDFDHVFFKNFIFYFFLNQKINGSSGKFERIMLLNIFQDNFIKGKIRNVLVNVEPELMGDIKGNLLVEDLLYIAVKAKVNE